MRDGVKLAADIYIPYSLSETARSLAVLQHQQYVLKDTLAKANAAVASAFEKHDKRGTESNVMRHRKLVVSIENVLARLTKHEQKIKKQIKPMPVYLEVTRYNRRTEHFWPLTLLRIWNHPRGASVNVWSWQAQQVLSANDYAVIIVDTRGSGKRE